MSFVVCRRTFLGCEIFGNPKRQRGKTSDLADASGYYISHLKIG